MTGQQVLALSRVFDPASVRRMGGVVAALAATAALGADHRAPAIGLLSMVLLGVAALSYPMIAPGAALMLLVVPDGWVDHGAAAHQGMVVVVLALAGISASVGKFGRRLPAVAWRWMRSHSVLLLAAVVPAIVPLIQIPFALPDPWHPIAQRSIGYVVGVAFLLVTILLVRLRRDARVVVAAVCAVVVLQAVLGIAQFLTRNALIMSGTLTAEQREEATNLPGYFRALGTLGHGNSLALLLVILGFGVSAWLVAATGSGFRVLGLVAFVAVTVALFCTISRAAVLMLPIVAAVLVVNWPRHLRRRVAKALLFALAPAALVVWLSPLAHALQRFVPGAEAGRDAGSNVVRSAALQAGWDSFLQAPWWGHGLGTSSTELPKINHSLVNLGAHNSYLDLFQGLGVLGVTIFAGSAFVIMRNLHQRPRGRVWLVTAGLWTLPAYGMFETLWQAPFLAMAGLCLGLALAVTRLSEGSAETPPSRLVVHGVRA